MREPARIMYAVLYGTLKEYEVVSETPSFWTIKNLYGGFSGKPCRSRKDTVPILFPTQSQALADAIDRERQSLAAIETRKADSEAKIAKLCAALAAAESDGPR